MKNKMIIISVLTFLTIVAACKKDSRDVDCNTITGATFTSNGGKMQSILETRCGVTSCHAPGGFGNDEWTYYDEYDSISFEFDRMYEQAIELGNMPPDTAASDLTSDERDVFECWKQAGFPE